MDRIVDRINSRRLLCSGKTRGIVLVSKEVENSDISELISSLTNKAMTTCVVVIDKEFTTPLRFNSNRLIQTASVWTDLGISVDKKVNALRLEPDYFIFKDLINKDNLEEIIYCSNMGYDVLCFTTLGLGELETLTNSSTEGKTSNTLIRTLGLY